MKNEASPTANESTHYMFLTVCCQSGKQTSRFSETAKPSYGRVRFTNSRRGLLCLMTISSDATAASDPASRLFSCFH